MERFTVTASFNGGLSQRPMFEGNQPSLPYTSLPPKSHLRDVSFSSYIQPGEPKLVAEDQLGQRTDDTEISIFDAERYFKEGQDQKESWKTSAVTVNLERISESCDVSAISRLSSVSSVDGYGRNYRTGSFNATPTPSSEASWNSQSGLLSNPPGSVSVSMRNLSLDGKKKGSSTKWFFGRNCPCSSKKSVQVEEKFADSKIPPVHLNCNSNGSLNPKKQSSKTGEVAVGKELKEKSKEFDKKWVAEERPELKLVPGKWAPQQEAVRESDRFSPENHFPSEADCRVVSSGRSFSDGGGFSFPILNPPTTGKLLLNVGKLATPIEDPHRESLEVYRPSDESVVRKSTELQRRLLMPFSSDGDQRCFNFPASPKTRTVLTDDDVASDASSDLFEIESFSTQTTSYPMYRRRDSLDEISSTDTRRTIGNDAGILHFRRSLDETLTSIAPSECYEPSEVSIDWSVTTAEGFDQGSITNFSISASDYEDVRFNVRQESERFANGGGGAAAGDGKRKINGLLSCRSDKAVNVGPHPVKCVSDQRRVGPPPVPLELGRIPASSRLVNLNSMHMTRPSGKPPLAMPHSARLSPAFATH